MTTDLTALAELLRYAIGSWPRTWRLLACTTPILAAEVLVRIATT